MTDHQQKTVKTIKLSRFFQKNREIVEGINIDNTGDSHRGNNKSDPSKKSLECFKLGDSCNQKISVSDAHEGLTTREIEENLKIENSWSKPSSELNKRKSSNDLELPQQSSLQQKQEVKCSYMLNKKRWQNIKNKEIFKGFTVNELTTSILILKMIHRKIDEICPDFRRRTLRSYGCKSRSQNKCQSTMCNSPRNTVAYSKDEKVTKERINKSTRRKISAYGTKRKSTIRTNGPNKSTIQKVVEENTDMYKTKLDINLKGFTPKEIDKSIEIYERLKAITKSHKSVLAMHNKANLKKLRKISMAKKSSKCDVKIEKTKITHNSTYLQKDDKNDNKLKHIKSEPIDEECVAFCPKEEPSGNTDPFKIQSDSNLKFCEAKPYIDCKCETRCDENPIPQCCRNKVEIKSEYQTDNDWKPCFDHTLLKEETDSGFSQSSSNNSFYEPKELLEDDKTVLGNVVGDGVPQLINDIKSIVNHKDTDSILCKDTNILSPSQKPMILSTNKTITSPDLNPTFIYVPKFHPPRSPHNLIEEVLYHDPWALLVATIFLNKTSLTLARPYILAFLKDYTNPFEVLKSKPEDLEKYFINIGLKKRSVQVWRMSHDFLHKNWINVGELYGIGKYGQDAYRMFCLGDFNVEPNDRFLKIYKAWYKVTEEMERKKLQASAEDGDLESSGDDVTHNSSSNYEEFEDDT